MIIVCCCNRISYLDGIQRLLTVKANALEEIEGNEVYVIVTDNLLGTHIHSLSHCTHRIDLGKNYYYRDQERSQLANMFVYT